MSHYKSNLRDIEFNLFEVNGTDKLLGTGPYADLDVETAKEILAEVERISREDLAASFEDSDRNPPVFDPKTNSAPVPAAFKKSYDTWMESGFWSLQAPAEIGGTAAPASLVWATAEMILGANTPIWMYGCGPFFSKVVYENGNERDQRIAEIMVERLWGATMVLTEPDAGSDVGAGKTFATANEDGSWNISGVKRFITSAESDLQENILHLVLARPRGVEGVGGPGTKGLSLFLVPKFHFNHQTGELTGERNGAYVTNVEHKMGIKVSNTCEVTFGDPQIGGGEPAKGWLLGEVHDGIRQMFDVIENARMMVGTKAISTLSTGYLNALEFAKTRVQGADLTNQAKDAPRVTITHHPDVRRSLMLQKAYAEGMRALVFYTTAWQDKIMLAKANGTTDSDEAKLAVRVNDLLLPIVKGYGSERSWTLLGTESLQTFGGSGFLQEYPLEQYVRDAKIDSIYEGTTAIQGQDFFFRKIVKDQGAAIGQLAGEIKAFLATEGSPELKPARDLLAAALGDAEGIVGHMFTDLMSAQEDISNIYKVAQNTSRLLLTLGDVVVAWQLLHQAEIATTALAAGASDKDTAFYQGKIAAAKFFASYTLPKIAAERAIAEAIDNSLMEVSEDAF
ncbi:acyl-CoA dehydrogenase [Nocardioides sp.]|uniref:acyl-CoA dehydrogenase n=1 Tax=Nocardioides sp. TaxID=35761 RepID=UPI00261CB78A|nr:acyl-CoA dehydrogenase [Nocardioides sp.]